MLKIKKIKSRRSFLKILLNSSLVASITSILYPVVSFLIPPKQSETKSKTILAGKLGELKLNSGKIFRFGTKPGILINSSEGKIKAFSAVCTHLDCTVQYREDLEHIWCACHNGHYDLNGLNIQGPPPRPLFQFKVVIIDDKIFVSKDTENSA